MTSSFLPTAASPMASPDPKIAMGWLHTAKFLTTAPELKAGKTTQGRARRRTRSPGNLSK